MRQGSQRGVNVFNLPSPASRTGQLVSLANDAFARRDTAADVWTDPSAKVRRCTDTYTYCQHRDIDIPLLRTRARAVSNQEERAGAQAARGAQA